MNKEKLEILKKSSDLLVQKLTETASDDVGQFPEFIGPLLYKVYTKSLMSEIADIQQLTSPVGRVYTLYSSYGGSDSEHINDSNSSIVVVSDGSGLSLEDTLTSTTGTGVIKYIEGNNLLVKITSGYFEKAQLVNGLTVIDVISNRNYVRKVFKNYNGPYSTSAGEYTKPLSFDHQIKSTNIEVKTRKLRSRITSEVLFDIKNQFGVESVDDILLNELSSEMTQTIDMEVIDYMRTIATPISDVVLQDSYGTQGDIMAVGNDIYVNVYKLINDIMRDTKRRKNFFILADPATVSLLMANPLHVKPEENIENTYFMGKIGGSYSLYMDPYATDHYVLVGYKNSNDNQLGDAGIIFAPYFNNVWSTIDPETGNSVFFNMVRYGFCVHPQDTTTGVADSIFFKTFNINMADIVNFSNIS